jgi:hypothetical protein
MAGTMTCLTCGQVNSVGTEYCVRCGTQLPDPSSTQLVGPPSQAGQGSTEYPWEPPAEWDPGELPAGAPTPPPPTWVAGRPDQVGWNTGHDTGAGYPAQPPPPQWGAPGYPAAPPPTQPPAGKPKGSRKPLILTATAVVVIAAIVAVVLVATGGKKSGTALNGVQNQNATDALASAREALRAASSVQISGTVFDNGSAIRLDLTLASGNDTQGTLTINNADVQLIKVGSNVFIKGDLDFLKKYAGNDTAVLDQLNGKWLKSTTTTDFDLFTLDGFAGLLKGGTGANAVIPTVTQSTLDGQKVVVVSQKDGSTLDIANTGPALPLKLDSKGSDGGTVTFANYNKSGTITAPPAGDVFDVSQASPSPSPTPTPTPTPTVSAFIGAWTCNGTGGTSGGNFTLNPDHVYSVVRGVNGSWGSSADHVAFAGGTLDKFAGVVTGNSMTLTGNGRTFSGLKH